MLQCSRYFPYFSLKIFCDTSLELSCRDGSNKGSQYMFFLLRNKEKISLHYFQYSLVSGTDIMSYPELRWSDRSAYLVTTFRLNRPEIS